MTKVSIPTSPFSQVTNKTGKHKDWYTPQFAAILCQRINPDDKYFCSADFCKQFKKSHSNLELKARLQLLAQLLDSHLPFGYKRQLTILSRLFGPPLPTEDGMFKHSFYLYPVSTFLELYGTRDIEQTIATTYQLTQRFTGEWVFRTIANTDPTLALRTAKKWSKDDNFHVRRLASEGLRPRLPWGPKIPWVNKAPQKLLPIYNKLRNDSVLYVRRSVANAMGDIIKLDDDLAYQTFASWLDKKKTRDNLWVIQHAIRHPVKNNVKKYVALKKKITIAAKTLD